MAEKISKGGGRKACLDPGPVETEPLFPRLHVNSADGEKKGGPRAPPRNKMALHEQLTIPSHRVLQPSARSATQMQGSSYEGRYSFYPVYFTPMPDTSAPDVGYQVYSQSASGVTHGSAAVDGTKPFPRVPAIVSSTAMGSSYVSDTSNNQSYLPGKKVRDEDDFRVPQCSNSRISSISTTEPCVLDKCQPIENCTRNPTGPSTFLSNTFQHEATVPTSFYTDSQERYMQVNSKDWSQIKYHLEQPIHLSVSFNNNNDCNVSLQKLGNSSNVAQVLALGQHTISEKHLIGTENNVDSVRWVGLSSNATSEGLLLPIHNIHREELVNVADVDEEREENADESRQREEFDPVSSLRNSCESTGGAECSSDANAAEISVASQPKQENGFEDDSDSSMVDSVSISKITPDVVIETIGKQHFWKARKAILRQQRIFSVQVFELHRLIKVQKLMAVSPILLNDKSCFDASFGKTSDEKMTSDNVAESEKDKKMNDGTQTNEQLSTNSAEPAVGQLAEPEAVCYKGLVNQGPANIMNCGDNSNMYAQSFPSFPVMVPGGMNAWGFPHPGFGFGQWTVPMSSPSGGFMYNPFAGGFPPAAFTGSNFGTPGSSRFPSFVEADQGTQSELKYGFPASKLQWGSPAFSLPVASPNFLPNCYGVPFSMFDTMCQAHAHVVPSVLAQNATAGEEAALITSGHVSAGIPSPCSGAVSHEQLASTLTNQSAFTDGNRSHTHCNQIPSGLYTPPQNLSNVPDGTRGIYCDQVKGNLWRLSEPGDFSGTNYLRGEEGKVQGVADPSEMTSKPHQEEEICTNNVAYQCEMTLERDTLALFPLLPSLGGREKPYSGREHGTRVIKVVPCNPVAAPETAAGILLSIQKERQKGE